MNDPPRLKDPLVEAGREELPDEAQLAALAAKLGPILGPGPGGGGGGAAGGGAAAGGAATAAKATIATSGFVKAMAVAATVGAIGVGGTVVAVRSRSDVPPAAPASVGLVVAPPPSSAIPDLALAPPPTVATTAPTHAASKPASTASDPEEEAKMLARAQDALSTPDRALAICADHARLYPNGALAQEREVLAIDALVRAGRRDEAKKRADAFGKVYPQSTHLRRVQVLVTP